MDLRATRETDDVTQADLRHPSIDDVTQTDFTIRSLPSTNKDTNHKDNNDTMTW